MCGRSRCSLAPERVEEVTGVPRERWVDADRYQPSYNVQPGRWTPILRLDEQQLPILQTMKWGLVPSFTKPGETPDHFRMFNARSETVTEKSIFSRLLPQQRCVVILDGFYEWKADAGGKKQPYYVSFGEEGVMRMAGLYDVWTGGPEGPMATYTILTVDASPKLAWLHNRMPVLLPDDDAVAAWLGGSSSSSSQRQQQGTEQEEPQGKGSSSERRGAAVAAAAVKGSAFKLVNQLCIPCNSGVLTWHPVTPAMSKPNYDSPDCCKDVRTKKGNISSFFKPQGAACSSKAPTATTAAAAGKGPTRQQQQQQQHSGKSPAQPAAAAAAAAAKESKEDLKPAQHHQQHVVSSPVSMKKGSISSFFKPVPSPASKGERQQQQQQQQEAVQAQHDADDSSGAVRNTDEQAGPSALDNAAAAAAASKSPDKGSGKRAAATKRAGVSEKKLKSEG